MNQCGLLVKQRIGGVPEPFTGPFTGTGQYLGVWYHNSLNLDDGLDIVLLDGRRRVSLKEVKDTHLFLTVRDESKCSLMRSLIFKLLISEETPEQSVYNLFVGLVSGSDLDYLAHLRLMSLCDRLIVDQPQEDDDIDRGLRSLESFVSQSEDPVETSPPSDPLSSLCEELFVPWTLPLIRF